MKRLFSLLLFLMACISAFGQGQGVRIDPYPVTSVSAQPLPGMAYPVLLAIPGASVSLCNYPANGLPCTNLAQTYTDASLATQCPLATQVVLNGTSQCVSQADPQGNFGFWVAAGGNYTYTVETPNGQVYGPFAFSATTQGCPTSGCNFTGPVTSTSNIVIQGFFSAVGIINTNTGFTFNNGAGTAGQCLVSNGTLFVPATCTNPPVFYQHMQLGSSTFPQEQNLSFNSSRFAVADVPGSNQTTVDLQTLGTSGACTLCSVNYDAFGRITSVSSGTIPSNGINYYFTFTGCTISNGSNLGNCNGNVQFTSGGNTSPAFTAMPDTSYYPFCTVNTGNQYTASFNIGNAGLTTTGFNYYWTEIMANGSTSSSPTIYCHLHHN